MIGKVYVGVSIIFIILMLPTWKVFGEYNVILSNMSGKSTQQIEELIFMSGDKINEKTGSVATIISQVCVNNC